MRRPIAAFVVVAVVSTVLVAVPPAQREARAWKPPTHLFGVASALQDAVDDGKVSVEFADGSGSTSADVNATIQQALQQFPDAYRAGAVGPDAFPDTLFGQGQIHPDTKTKNSQQPPAGPDTAQSFEWLQHLWEQAWGPPGAGENQLENIAFALGFMGGHANGDTWAHTWVNKYAKGVFPDFDDLANSDISVRHLVVEGYADKHRPGYESNTGFTLNAPDAFVARTLIFSQFARDRSSSPLYDFFLDLQGGLGGVEQDVEHDNTTQDELCGSAFGATVCVPDPTDSPINVIEWGIDLLIEEYLEAWIDDIDRGLREWVDVWETIAIELMSGKKPNSDNVFAAFKEWVLTSMLSMLGVPDFVGEGLYLISEIVDFVLGLITGVLSTVFSAIKAIPVIGDLVTFVEGVYDDAKSFVNDIVDKVAGIFITLALGFTDLNPATKDAIDKNDDGIVTPREVIRVLQEPEEYIEDPALFPAGTRAAVDADMALSPGVEDDANDIFRDYSPTDFKPLFDTAQMARLAMLDENGLNQLFDALVGGNLAVLNDLYGPHANQSGGWTVPNNIMTGWNKSLDAEYQWRANSPNDGRSYGTGTLNLFEDCLSRDRVFRRVFKQPVAGIDAFGDAGDPPTGITDSQPPTSALTLDGRNVTNSGQTFLSGTTKLQINSSDNYFADGDLRVLIRAYPDGAAPPAYPPATDGVPADPTPFTLTGEDGKKVVQFFAVDDRGRCNAEAEQTKLFTLDNTPPTITITEPAADSNYLSDVVLTTAFSADDGPGSGVDPTSARHYADSTELTPVPTVIDMFDYPAGSHLYRAEQADFLGNLGSAEAPWTTVVSHQSLHKNLDKAFSIRSCIKDFPTYHSLSVKLKNAEAADARGNDGASDKELEAFKNEIAMRQGELTEPGKTITPYCGAILTTNATALQAA